MALLSAADPQLGALAGRLPAPSPDQVGVVALLLDTGTAGGGVPPPGCVAPPFCQAVDLAALQDIEALGPTISNTLEIGYKGLFGDRVSFSANAWCTRYDSYISSLRLISPNLFLNGPEVKAYLENVFRKMIGVAFPNEAAALATAETLASRAGQIPLGSVVPTSTGGTTSPLALGYQDVGGFDVVGGELGAGFLLSDQLEMAASLSVINKNTFETAGELVREVSLNSPTVRGTASLTYRNRSIPGRGRATWTGSRRWMPMSGPAFRETMTSGSKSTPRTYSTTSTRAWREPQRSAAWCSPDCVGISIRSRIGCSGGSETGTQRSTASRQPVQLRSACHCGDASTREVWGRRTESDRRGPGADPSRSDTRGSSAGYQDAQRSRGSGCWCAPAATCRRRSPERGCCSRISVVRDRQPSDLAGVPVAARVVPSRQPSHGGQGQEQSVDKEQRHLEADLTRGVDPSEYLVVTRVDHDDAPLGRVAQRRAGRRQPDSAEPVQARRALRQARARRAVRVVVQRDVRHATAPLHRP